jgi:hypothetical protein
MQTFPDARCRRPPLRTFMARVPASRPNVPARMCRIKSGSRMLPRPFQHPVAKSAVERLYALCDGKVPRLSALRAWCFRPERRAWGSDERKLFMRNIEVYGKRKQQCLKARSCRKAFASHPSTSATSSMTRSATRREQAIVEDRCPAFCRPKGMVRRSSCGGADAQRDRKYSGASGREGEVGALHVQSLSFPDVVELPLGNFES